MADYLVTGASGFLGAHILRVLAARGAQAVGITHRHILPAPGRSVSLDLTRTRAVADLVRAERPRAIIHAAALTAPDYCEANPGEADTVNVTATGALAMAAFAANAHLVFISTDLVFDGFAGMYTEVDPPSPINHYARTKAQAEHYVRAASPDFAVVRPSFLYGEPLAEHHASFSHALYVALRAGTPTKVFHDQYRSPLPAWALAEAAVEIADRKLGGIWHVAGPDRASRADFARALAAVAGLDPAPLAEVSMDSVPLPAPRPRDVSLNTTKARTGLRTYLPSLADGLRRDYGLGG